jgi:hypothetical protein
MAVNACLNNFRLLNLQMPSATWAEDMEAMERNIATLPIVTNSEFAAIPTLEFDIVGIPICRISKDGECEGFFPQSSLATATIGEQPIRGLTSCDRKSNVWTFTAPDLKLADIDQTLRDYEAQQPALLGDQPAPPSEPDTAQGFSVTSEEPRAALICNAKSPVTNIRAGPNSKAFAVVAKLKNGDKISVTGTTANPETGHNWLRVDFGEGSGFIDSDFVSSDCNLDKPTNNLSGMVFICNDKSPTTAIFQSPFATETDILIRMLNYESVEIIGSSNDNDSNELFYKVSTFVGPDGYVPATRVSKSCDLPAKMKSADLGNKAFGQGANVVCSPAEKFSEIFTSYDVSDRSRVARLNNNDDIMVLERVFDPRNGTPWFHVEDTKGRKGFINALHVSETQCR